MRRTLLALPLLVSLIACQKQEFGPITTPAAQHPIYARAFPTRLTASVQLYDVEHTATKEFLEKMKSYPAPLKDTSWPLVAETYRLAEADGKSAHYVRMRQENSDVGAFINEEKKEIVRKISGSVQYQAKQDHCSSQFHGAVDGGFERGMAESFDTRREDNSQAQLFIAENQAKLGKGNIKALRQHADAIATTSYLVHVLLSEHHRDLSQMVKEASRVEATLSERLEALEASRNSSETEDEKKARNLEQEQLFTARAELEHALAGAKKRLESSEDEVQAAREAFARAMDALLADVEKR